MKIRSTFLQGVKCLGGKARGLLYHFQDSRSKIHRRANMANAVECDTLYTGQKIPLVGLGTWKSAPGQVKDAVKYALSVGYRHIDCASVYGNETEVGEAIKESLADPGLKREEIFVTSKLWNNKHHPDDVEGALKKTLADLQLSYLDLYLMHWPYAFKRGENIFPQSMNGSLQYDFTDYRDTWKAMEKLVETGLTKAIGLSNFNKRQIDDILGVSTIKPAVLQVECHPYLAQNELIAHCRANGLVVTGYSPLGSPDRSWRKPEDPVLLEEPSVLEMAKKYGKSEAQILLRMEETEAPSTSTEKVEGGEDVDTEAKKLMGAGRRHMVMKDVRSAVNAFQEASSLLGKKYGETADQCADAFFSYGMALLELARMEDGVLGNALEGIPEGEPEEEDGEKEEDNPKVPSAANLDEGEGDDSEEAEENEGTEEKETEEEDVDNLQLAWEMLDLSKVIFKRQQNKESQLKAAQAHLKLGEVSIESENYGQAIEDFLACLNIQKEHLEEHDRLLAETHYQLGLAYQYSTKHDSAISHFTQSTEAIEKRMALLTEQLEKAAGEATEELKKEMEELKGLLPDIKEKIEDSKEAQKTADATEKALKETLIGASSGFSQENGSASSSSAAPAVSSSSISSSSAPAEKNGDSTVPSNCVSDISHLVRKKRKPEEDSPLKEAKKPKAEPVENGAKNGSGNGDAVVPTNEEAEKAEEADKQTPMETTAVESTA